MAPGHHAPNLAMEVFARATEPAPSLPQSTKGKTAHHLDPAGSGKIATL